MEKMFQVWFIASHPLNLMGVYQYKYKLNSWERKRKALESQDKKMLKNIF